MDSENNAYPMYFRNQISIRMWRLCADLIAQDLMPLPGIIPVVDCHFVQYFTAHHFFCIGIKLGFCNLIIYVINEFGIIAGHYLTMLSFGHIPFLFD